LEKSCTEGNSIEFIDLIGPFVEADKRGEELFWEHDIHFNTGGHEITAERIKEIYPDIFPN